MLWMLLVGVVYIEMFRNLSLTVISYYIISYYIISYYIISVAVGRCCLEIGMFRNLS